MSLGTFQKETLTPKISKQPEHEATSQVKSKLENSTTAYASVLVPRAHFPAVQGMQLPRVPSLPMSRVSGSEEAALLSAPGLSAHPAVPIVRGFGFWGDACILARGEGLLRLHHQALRHACRGRGGRARARSRPARPHHCEPTRQPPLGPAGLLFFLIPMLMLTSRPIAFPSI